MGILSLVSLLRPKSKDAATTRSALDQAAADPNADSGSINQLINRILAVGLDGAGPYPGAAAVAKKALSGGTSPEAAVDKVIRSHVAGGGIGGLATSLGGFITMPIAIPVNVFEFYVQAARMVGAVAAIRGYDVSQPNIRTAVLLTMVGSNSDEVLAKAGVTTGGGRLAQLAARQLPQGAMMMINKGIGFQLLKKLGEGTLEKLGRGVPVAGGIVGGAIDSFMMNKIGAQARKEFPAR